MSFYPKKCEIRFVCSLSNGLHARPASRFGEVLSGFSSRVSIENLNNSRSANVRSVLSLVGADIKKGDECLLRIEGEDQGLAYKKIVNFLNDEFSKCDDLSAEDVHICQESFTPPVLDASGVKIFNGTSVVSGVGRGRVVFLQPFVSPEQVDDVGEKINVEEELHKIDSAIAKYRSDLNFKLDSNCMSGVESDVVKAHLSIANDVELIEKINSLIREQKKTAGKAIADSFIYFSEFLKTAESKLIRERIIDLRDVCSQLLVAIYGYSKPDSINLTERSICVAKDLSPSEFINMDKSFLAGLVLDQIGSTSHVVILARSFGIPIITDIKGTRELLDDGQEVIVDANYGLLIPEINCYVERFYNSEEHNFRVMQQKLNRFKTELAQTSDAKRVEVMANVSTADEVKIAMDNGAEGIGLFRTEMLFLGRDKAPSEQEQFEEYKKAAIWAMGNPVIIRTFDIGGDKKVEYIQEAADENPILGYRGVRIYKQYERLFRDQLSAILRASIHGNLKIMIPMITSREEILYVRQVIEDVKAELLSKSIAYNNDISLGIMVEVPSVSFIIPQLAGTVDFLSIGSNDLTQYFLAVDRCNGKVSSLYQSHHPGLLGLIRKIVYDAHRHGLWVGICGEMAGQIQSLPLLLGAGIDELSVSVPYITKVKAACADCDSIQCAKALDQAREALTLDQVDEVVSECRRVQGCSSIIDTSLVAIDLDCLNKAEVIKYISDALWLVGRTYKPVLLEEDFWLREKVYSTGLGYGFAVPHCKSSHININSICVLRLKKSIEWDAIDGKPVQVIVAITIPERKDCGNIHLSVFSKLARKIMHKGFREQLMNIGDCQGIVDYLHEKLELNQS